MFTIHTKFVKHNGDVTLKNQHILRPLPPRPPDPSSSVCHSSLSVSGKILSYCLMTTQIPLENAAGIFAIAIFSCCSTAKKPIYHLQHTEPSQEHPHITIHRHRFRLQYRLKRTDISRPSSCSVCHGCRT